MTQFLPLGRTYREHRVFSPSGTAWAAGREEPRFAKNPVVVRILTFAISLERDTRKHEGQQGEAMEPAGHGAGAGQHFPAKALHPPQAL